MDFPIKDMSSRAIYCPTCRQMAKQFGMVVNLDRQRFCDEQKQAT
jgi:hypothetical protein